MLAAPREIDGWYVLQPLTWQTAHLGWRFEYDRRSRSTGTGMLDGCALWFRGFIASAGKFGFRAYNVWAAFTRRQRLRWTGDTLNCAGRNGWTGSCFG